MKNSFAVHSIALGLAATTAAMAEEPILVTAALRNAEDITIGHATLAGKRNGVLIQSMNNLLLMEEATSVASPALTGF
jgi:hypothetical protein